MVVHGVCPGGDVRHEVGDVGGVVGGGGGDVRGLQVDAVEGAEQDVVDVCHFDADG